MKTLTNRDIRICAWTARELQAGQDNCDHCGGGPCESDCYASESVCLSIGYVDITADGVMCHGRTIDIDTLIGDREFCRVCDGAGDWTCPHCDGTGWEPPHWSEGEVG